MKRSSDLRHAEPIYAEPVRMCERYDRMRCKECVRVENLEKENKRLRQLLHNWGLNADAVPREMPKSLLSEGDRVRRAKIESIKTV